jgi:hypothetical protein
MLTDPAALEPVPFDPIKPRSKVSPPVKFLFNNREIALI